MALELNGTSIPATGNLNLNGTSLAVLNLNATEVWRKVTDVNVLKELRADYAHSADSLTAASQVIAINFQTLAAANGYWRHASGTAAA